MSSVTETIVAASRQVDMNRRRIAILSSFAVATVLLSPLEWYLAGGAFAAICAWLCGTDPDPALRRRMAVLLLCVGILALAPIDTDTRPFKFVTLGGPFLACVVLPAVLLHRTDPGVIRFRFWPRRFRWLDIFYLVISFPLAKWILDWYFRVNPFMPQQWPLPPQPEDGAMTRLFWGINGVGVWDELFFVNTVYAVLRSLFPFWIANLVQAVVYTAVLNHMAFIGIGPILVYLFALTQGSMFEESENLLYVLIVHLVVDYFLYWEIVMGHYPNYVQTGFLH